MKSIKKYLAYILCICLMFTLITPTVSAQTNYDYTSVSESLFKIGVLKELKPELNAFLTRGELAQMVSPLVGDFSSVSNVGMFSDVSSEHQFADDIYILSTGKVMNGYSDGTFRPDNHVTMNEALKIFTTLLGYGPVAERWGGYPVAYVKAAHESKLTKYVNAWGDEPITYGEAVQLLYNTVTADMLQVTGASSDGLTIERHSGISLLTECFDIHQYEGVLEATGITSVTGGKSVSKGTILVGKERFRVTEEADYSEFLGCFVKCYYTGTVSDGEAVLLVKDYNKNEETLLPAQDIVDVEKSGDITISYRTQDGRIKKQSIDSYADVIYNGKAYPSFSHNDLMIKAGYINLIDNDTDSDIDVISVTEFDTVVVKSVSKSDKKVYGVYAIDETGANSISLDDEELEKVKIITSTGAQCSIEDIARDNVLSVARSKDNEVILCIVENVGIIGEITALENDGQTVSSCVINDNIYDLTKEFAQEIKTNSEQKRNFVLGRSLRFAITHDGKIAYSFESEGGEQYGYLLNAAFGTNAIKPDEGEFLIYSQNGELIQVNGAKKIETNSGSGKNSKETISQWDAVNNIGITNNGEVVQQLIKYELNDKGELNKLYYATKSGDAAAFDYESERFYKTDITSAPNVYRSSTSSIGEYTVSDNTIIFMIEKRDSDGKVESDGIRITPLNFTDSQAYSFSAYDYSAYKAPKAVVLDSSDRTDKNGVSDDAFILQKKIKVITDGEEYDKIIGLMNGVSKEYVLSENFTVFDINGGTAMTLNDLEEGDAFLVAADMSGRLTKCVQVCDISNDKKPEYKAIRFPKSSTGTYGNSACSAVVGNVADYTFNAIGVRTKDLKDNTDKITGHSIVKKSYFYLYDSSEPKNSRVKAVTADELVAETLAGNGSRVVVASRYTAIRTAIIIK